MNGAHYFHLTIVLLMFSVSGCITRTDLPTPDFTTHVKPILERNCLPCHNTGTLLGKLNLEGSEYVFSEKYGGPYIVPGDPWSSRLYRVIGLPPDSEEAMPPLKHKLSLYQKSIIRIWIQDGAHWPEGAEGKLVPLGTTPWQTPDPQQLF